MPTSFDPSWLPETAPNELRDIIFSAPELIPEMPFRRVSVSPELGADFEIQTPYDFDYYCEKSKKRVWAAEAICPFCENRLYFEWGGAKNGRPSLLALEGEDGAVYESLGVNEEHLTRWNSGDILVCPRCGEKAVLKHISRYGASGEHRKQVAVQSLELVRGYTVLMTWMACVASDRNGYVSCSVRPIEAIVVTENGRLSRYVHEVKTGFAGRIEIPLDKWQPAHGARDYMQVAYNSYSAINNRAIGGYIFNNQEAVGKGTTGEKTGLSEYMAGGGANPALYLKEWRKHKNLENLMKSAAGSIVVEKINDAVKWRYQYGMGIVSWIDWTGIDFKRAKPHEMLGLSKQELRWVVELNDAAGILFISKAKKAGLSIEQAVELKESGYGKIANIAIERDAATAWSAYKYLKKKEHGNQMIDMLRDYWSWIDFDAADHAQRYPRDLKAAHDAEEKKNKNGSADYRKAGFDKVQQKYGALEWSCGDYCILLPKSNEELIAEGDTLHHCVGRYADGHVSEKTVVFFVRHKRRPERSWYTMDYDFTGREPRRNQMHGYHNERILDAQKAKILHISPEAERFVEKWEQEVLRTFWAKIKAKKKAS